MIHEKLFFPYSYLEKIPEDEKQVQPMLHLIKELLNSRLIQQYSELPILTLEGVWRENTVVHRENNLEKIGLESKHSELPLISH